MNTGSKTFYKMDLSYSIINSIAAYKRKAHIEYVTGSSFSDRRYKHHENSHYFSTEDLFGGRAHRGLFSKTRRQGALFEGSSIINNNAIFWLSTNKFMNIDKT